MSERGRIHFYYFKKGGKLEMNAVWIIFKCKMGGGGVN